MSSETPQLNGALIIGHEVSHPGNHYDGYAHYLGGFELLPTESLLLAFDIAQQGLSNMNSGANTVDRKVEFSKYGNGVL